MILLRIDIIKMTMVGLNIVVSPLEFHNLRMEGLRRRPGDDKLHPNDSEFY